MVYRGVLVFLGLIVYVTCQQTANNTYACNTGDECHSSVSLSVINGIRYCCNGSDSMNLGHIVLAGNNVLMGKRNNVTAHLSDLQCHCTIRNPVDDKKLNQHIQNQIMPAISQSLKEIEQSVSDTLNGLQHLFGKRKE